MVRKIVAVLVGLAVLIITPYFVYDRLTAFRFDAGDMRAAIEGTWELEVAPKAGARAAYTLTIEQATEADAAKGGSAPQASRGRGLIRSAAACGSRTLVRSAAACIDLTRMPLRVRIAGAGAGPRSPEPEATGTFAVDGLAFESGYLELEIGDASVTAKIAPSGEVVSATMHEGTARLARVAAR